MLKAGKGLSYKDFKEAVWLSLDKAGEQSKVI
jgi:hypothetical protein